MTETILGMPVVMKDALPDSIPFVLTLGHFNDYQMKMKATMKPEASVKTRFLELLEQHPELTRPQAYMQAVMENAEKYLAYRGYRVPPELASEVLARLENNGHKATLD